MARPELKAVVLGDSAMWGQGLREEDKFSIKSVKEIATVLGRRVRIVENFSRSGAVIRAGGTANEAYDKRDEFVDTYPALFDSDQALATRFLIDDKDDSHSQDVALELNRENPCSFPTVEKQVQRVPTSVAHETELVLLNGGANDLDFEVFFDPQGFRRDFVEHFDGILKDIAFVRVRSLLEQTRHKFPNALILYTGYFAPFAPGESNSELETLFEHLSHAASWEIWANDNIIELTPVEQLVIEAQYRAQFGAGRALHWTTAAIAEVNADPALRGPGIIFIHPQFAPANTVFAARSFFHQEYESSKINDEARHRRIRNCPREKHFDAMTSTYISLTQGFITTELARKLRQTLDGPSGLLKVLDRLAENPADASDRTEALSALRKELERIDRVRIASFLHPNEKGAQQYTDVIVTRYTERYRQMTFKEDLRKLNGASGGSTTSGIRESMRRYGFRSVVSLRAMSPLMLVDSIALEVVTSTDSSEQMYDDVFLSVGGEHRWRLNFPYRHIVFGSNISSSEILHRHFKPGATDLFTVDARGMHLANITELVMDSQVTEFSNGAWKPSRVTLYINGIEVFTSQVRRILSRTWTFSFPYPTAAGTARSRSPS